MHFIHFKGQPYPVNFGKAGIIKLEELTGQNFYDFLIGILPDVPPGLDEFSIGLAFIKNTSVTNMVNILTAGLHGGALKEKSKPLTMDEVIDLLDEEGEAKSIAILTEAAAMVIECLPKPAPQEAGEEKKTIPETV